MARKAKSFVPARPCPATSPWAKRTTTTPAEQATIAAAESQRTTTPAASRGRCVSMEPGGIEPPSRDSQQDASTRVVDRLISASHRGSTPCALAQPLETSSTARQEAPRADQPDDRDLPPHRASGGRSEACIRPPLRTAVRQLLCLRDFYEAITPLDAPHQAFPIRSNAISAPGFQRARKDPL